MAYSLSEPHNKPKPDDLPIPDGFRSVMPLGSDWTTYRKRELPHLEHPDATYFVTFRTEDSWILPKPVRVITLSSGTHWNGTRIDLDVAVVMPEHVHMIFRILDGSRLGRIMQSIKGYSAKQIKATGQVWEHEGFDHIVRHETAWRDKTWYVIQNPVKRGLVERPSEYAWLWVREELRAILELI